MTAVVAVVDTAGRQARLTSSLVEAFDAHGLELLQRTQRELVAEVSVEQGVGSAPLVLPDRPLLWLSPGDSGWPDTADGRFLSSETFTAARSIGTLTAEPVLNRPSAVSPCGTFAMRPALAARRARHDGEGHLARAECFTSSRPVDASPFVEVFDYATVSASYGWPVDGAGPYRHRPAVLGVAPVKIIVAGDEAIAPPDVPELVLTACLGLVRSCGLDLATTWWLVDPAGGMPTLARIDCWLWDGTFARDDRGRRGVAAAIAGWMAERLLPARTAPS